MTSALILAALAAAMANSDPLEPLGRLSDPAIRETSGIFRSRRHADLFWILSASGNPPAIHAIRRDGRVVASFRVAAPNIDWEEIAADDAGQQRRARHGRRHLPGPSSRLLRRGVGGAVAVGLRVRPRLRCRVGVLLAHGFLRSGRSRNSQRLEPERTL